MRLTKVIPISLMVVFLLGLFYCAGSADEEMVKASSVVTPTVGENIVPIVDCVVETIPVVEDTNEITINDKMLHVYSDGIISTVQQYIYDTCESKGYTECTIFDILDEEDYIFLHIVFDNIQYKGVNVDKDPIDLFEVYDCRLTEDFIEYWEYN